MQVVTSKEVALRILRERIPIDGKYSFKGIDLRKEDLSGANLSNSEWRDCDFLGANLSRATIVHTRFIGCNFQVADFTHAKISHTRFSNCRLERSTFVANEFMEVYFVDGTRLCECVMTLGDFRKRRIYIDADHYAELMKFAKPYNG